MRVVRPRRLPKRPRGDPAAMGQLSLDPDVGESDGARWFMTEAESVPYSPELDRSDSDRHGHSRRYHLRRIFRRSRRRALRGALGIRPLGARSGAPPGYATAISTCRSRPASSCGSRPSTTARSGIPGMSGPFVSRWSDAQNLQGNLNDETFLANCGDLLLDGALMKGVELPHDCRSGVCGACRVRLVEARYSAAPKRAAT